MFIVRNRVFFVFVEITFSSQFIRTVPRLTAVRISVQQQTIFKAIMNKNKHVQLYFSAGIWVT